MHESPESPPSLSPLPPHSEVTPSNTTVTLPTPDLVRVPLARSIDADGGPFMSPSVPGHNPTRFIFYPISWDGSEASLDMQIKKATLPNLTYAETRTDYADDPAALYSTDAFWSIDRWRRDVVKSDDNLLDPIQDVDSPLPLLSLPHDRPASLLRNTRPVTSGTDGNGSEDEIQLWIHP